MQFHIAIFRQPYLNWIFDGLKTIESRFTKNKIAPFGRVQIGDVIYLKLSGGMVIGRAGVAKVFQEEKLTPDRIRELVEEYRDALQIQPSFLEMKLNSNYVVLIWLEKVERITPWEFKKRDQRSWIIFDSDPYLTNTF